MPALRILPRRANAAVYRLTPRATVTQLPPRSNVVPWCGVPRKTILRRCRGQACPASSP